MIFRFVGLALALAVTISASPSFASAAPAATSVDRVGGVTIIRQPDAASMLVGTEFVVRAGLNRQTLAQSGLAALVAQTVLRTPVAATGLSLEDAIAAQGGSIHFDIDPDDVRFYVESLPASGTAVLGLFAQALAAPSFAPGTVRDARSALIKKIVDSQNSALQVGLDMLSGADSSQGNTGLPKLGTPASLAQFVPDDARGFYTKFYRSGGVVVSSVGRLDALGPDALTQLAAALPAGSTQPVAVALPQLSGASRQLVAHRDVAAPWLVARYPAPPVDSKDFGPMLVLTAFLQRTLADISEVPGVVSQTFASHAVGAVYAYDRHPASLTLYVNGGIGNPNRAFTSALSIATILGATKLQGSIETFKSMAYGDFATNSTALESRAWLAAVFAQSGLSPDYITTALQAIQTTTPADLQRVARAYLGNPTIALVLPRDQ